jgi:hypothetical protein
MRLAGKAGNHDCNCRFTHVDGQTAGITGRHRGAAPESADNIDRGSRHPAATANCRDKSNSAGGDRGAQADACQSSLLGLAQPCDAIASARSHYTGTKAIRLGTHSALAVRTVAGADQLPRYVEYPNGLNSSGT